MNREPTEEEKRLMKRYGIEAELKTVYRYEGHTYEHLDHAIRYAKIDAVRSSGVSDELPSRKSDGLKALWEKITGRIRRRNV
jgi:hypothetical protein